VSTVLSCWKDIARYLGKGVRTVQRWETEMGLPIRRIERATYNHPVFAIPEELDQWVQTQGQHKRSELDMLRLENAELRKRVQELEQILKISSDRTRGLKLIS
jgi:hypothetical protein